MQLQSYQDKHIRDITLYFKPYKVVGTQIYNDITFIDIIFTLKLQRFLTHGWTQVAFTHKRLYLLVSLG